MPKKINKHSLHRPSEAKAARHKLGILYGIVILLLLTILVTIVIVLDPFRLRASSVKASEITNARNSYMNAYQKHKAEQVDLLTAAGVITESKISYLSSRDTCELSTEGTGFATKLWHENCFIEDVDLYETSLDGRVVLSKLAGEQKTEQILGRSQKLFGDCGVLYEGSGITTRYIRPNRDGTVCRLPSQSETDSMYRKTQVIKSTSEDKIDKSHAYVVIISQNKYFDATLGCKSGLYIGCVSPIDEPVVDF